MKLPEDDTFVEGLLCRGDKLLLFGAEKTGKSLLATNWGIELARGEPLSTIFNTTRALKVLYFQSEISRKRMQNRILKMFSKKVPPRSRFEIVDRKALTILEEANFKLVCRKIEEFKPDVVVFDPLFKFTYANLSDSDIITKAILTLDSILQRYQVAIIIVHHTRKPAPGDVEKFREGSFAEAYGSRFLTADADSMVKVARPKAKDRKLIKLYFQGRDEDIDPVEIRRDETLWFCPITPAERLEDTLSILIETIDEHDPKAGELETILGQRIGGSGKTVRENIINPAIEAGFIEKRKRTDKTNTAQFIVTDKGRNEVNSVKNVTGLNYSIELPN